MTITGEAGIGKSRLKNELRDNPTQNVRWLEGRCQAFTQTASYAPLVQILRALVQLTGAEASQVARTKLRVALRSLVGDKYEQVHPAVAHLLGMEREPGQSYAARAQVHSAGRSMLMGWAIAWSDKERDAYVACMQAKGYTSAQK